MQSNRLKFYYLLKPYIPREVRMWMRRRRALKKRPLVENVWPIKPGTERPPVGWPGWPEGKQFAVVLTHDVESPVGLSRIKPLMELEMSLGFRSCFNLIPEGPYTATRELRDYITSHGFEVGVHDCHHDGRLFSSRAHFQACASRINHYLKEWNATGFRAGFMHHNLEWLHDLDIQYDCSTFDTDPFEPQPDGVDTIFPFFVPSRSSFLVDGRSSLPTVGSVPSEQRQATKNVERRTNVNAERRTSDTEERRTSRNEERRKPNEERRTKNEERFNIPRSGYVELPYTLPQDFTLFLLLAEGQADIWLNKLDWLAKHGGMALLNVHPDYLSFDNQANGGSFPIDRYLGLLRYLARRYQGAFFQTTPRELAKWYCGTLGAPQTQPDPPADLLSESQPTPVTSSARKGKLAGKRAAAVVFSYYPADPRPRRESEALVAQGMEVDLFCLRESESEPWQENCGGVSVFRLPLRRRREGKFVYLLQYAWFTLFAFARLSLRSLVRRYDLVHVHNMPDFLVFVGLVPRLLGARLILDLHDPVPEVAMTKYRIPAGHLLIRCARLVERVCIRFADLCLTPNEAFRKVFIARGCPPAKMQIVMNSPQPHIFNPARSSVGGDINRCAGSGDPVYKSPVGRVPSHGVNYEALHSNGESSAATRPFTLMYHGLLAQRYGLDVALEAFAQVRSAIPGARFLIFGGPTPYLSEIQRIIRDLGLVDSVEYRGWKSLEEIAQMIIDCDLGIIPNRRTPFTEINMPTRIFEYLAMDKPVIAPRTRGIRDYFAEDEAIFFEPDDVCDLATKIEWACRHPEEVQGLVAKGQKVYQAHRWELEAEKLTGLVAALIGQGDSAPAPSPMRRRRICMVTYSHYETDNRVMRYAEELAHCGDEVEVFSLKRDHRQASRESIEGVNVCRVQTRSRKNQQTKFAYLLPILKFLCLASARITWRHLRRPYDIVHVHNVPDFLVFAAWLPKLTGAKVILDIHDIVPEFYASKFGAGSKAVTINTLEWLERVSAKFAHHVIMSNHLWLQKYQARTGANGKCSVFINNVDTHVFSPHLRQRACDEERRTSSNEERRTSTNEERRTKDASPLILFPGGLQWHQGLDIAIRAFAKISAKLPRAEFHIYGDGNMRESLIALTAEFGLNGKVRFFEPAPVHEIAGIMANADLGVVPKRADGFGNEAYSTKIMEFMSLGVPVVVSSTKIDRYYFDDSVVRFFESGNPDAMAEAMLEVLQNEELRTHLTKNALAYAERNSWDRRKGDYLALVDSLCRS